MPSFVLKDATLVSGDVVDVKVTDDRIEAVGNGLSAEQVIDCSKLMLLPGLVDLHTHLREPGFEQSETVLTGSQSAALGGFTAVHAMANTLPVADNAQVVENVYDLGQRAGYVDVFPIGAVTMNLGGEQLADIGSMANSRAQVKVFSDDGKCVSDALLMRRALEYIKTFDGVLAQHAQEPRLTQGAQMNEGAMSAKLGLAGWPAVAEESIIARDVLLAEHLGARLHVCHLSTEGSVEIVRAAKARGVSVTAEVTPHHLLLDENLLSGYDAIYKVNPPLRTKSDTLALRAALVDGTIDIVATDHAPHPLESKQCEFSAAAFGMVGLEVAASIAQLVLVDSGAASWSRFAEVLSIAPARIAGDSEHGQAIIAGSKANLTLIDPAAKRTIALQTHSKSVNNPYSGMTLPGRVVHTIFNGYFTVKNGKLASEGRP